MSDFMNITDLTVPANTAQATPINQPILLGLCKVDKVQITFPPGCSGLVGAAIYAGGSPAYPNQSNKYLAFDDLTFNQDVANQINSGQWAVVAYNTDVIPHTLQVIFHADYLVQDQSAPSSAPISL